MEAYSYIGNVTSPMGISLFVLKIFSLQFALQRADKAELSGWSGLSGQSVILDINPEQWKVGEGISFNPALPSDTETCTNWAQHPQFLLQKTLKILHNNLQIINLCFLKCYIREVKHYSVTELSWSVYCMSTFSTISIVSCSIFQSFLNLSPLYKVISKCPGEPSQCTLWPICNRC